jgi:hypothetical protein
MWGLYTFLAAALSFVASAFINFGRHGFVSQHDLIGHGELFTFTSSLLMGSIFLLSKDKGLEPFIARRLFTLLAFSSAILAEIGFILLKLTAEGDLLWVAIAGVENFSVYLAGFCVLLVFTIVFIDASRIDTENAIDAVENSYQELSKKMDGAA